MFFSFFLFILFLFSLFIMFIFSRSFHYCDSVSLVSLMQHDNIRNSFNFVLKLFSFNFSFFVPIFYFPCSLSSFLHRRNWKIVPCLLTIVRVWVWYAEKLWKNFEPKNEIKKNSKITYMTLYGRHFASTCRATNRRFTVTRDAFVSVCYVDCRY